MKPKLKSKSHVSQVKLAQNNQMSLELTLPHL